MICQLIKKVLEINKFKKNFKANPEKYFLSRKLYVTFDSLNDIRIFKELYKHSFSWKFLHILRKKPDDFQDFESTIDSSKPFQSKHIEPSSKVIPSEDSIKENKKMKPINPNPPPKGMFYNLVILTI